MPSSLLLSRSWCCGVVFLTPSDAPSKLTLIPLKEVLANRIVDALLVVYEPERAFQEITISMTSSADTKVAEGADMMGWMEALEITRFGGGADRASLANSAFQGAYTSDDRDMYPSAAPSHRGRLCRSGEGCTWTPKNGGIFTMKFLKDSPNTSRKVLVSAAFFPLTYFHKQHFIERG